MGDFWLSLTLRGGDDHLDAVLLRRIDHRFEDDPRDTVLLAGPDHPEFGVDDSGLHFAVVVHRGDVGVLVDDTSGLDEVAPDPHDEVIGLVDRVRADDDASDADDGRVTDRQVDRIVVVHVHVHEVLLLGRGRAVGAGTGDHRHEGEEDDHCDSADTEVLHFRLLARVGCRTVLLPTILAHYTYIVNTIF